MHPAESLGWSGFQALKSRLSVRLSRFTRDKTASTRPSRLQNDAVFFESDLRYTLKATPMDVDISLHDYYDMDQMAQELLTSLNDMANGDLIDTQTGPSGQRPRELESDILESSLTSPHDIKILNDKFPRLSSLIAFLDTSQGEFNLTTGPGAVLFTLPQGQAGSIAMERVAKWKAFLERLAVGARNSQGPQVISVPETNFLAQESEEEQFSMHQRGANVVVNAMFKEFQQRNCGETHEIKLKVSDDWQTGSDETVLDMFVNCCSGGDVWQQARCGPFQVKIDESERDGLCEAIQRAREQGRKLYLFADQRGLFDVSDKMPPLSLFSDTFTTESLGELLDQKVFTRITPRDYLAGSVIERFGSREKATLALSLARCLMDFFDEDLELVSDSWKPETVYFLRHAGTNKGDRLLYITLKPKVLGPKSPDLLRTIGPGNPVLLSFAKLLLEIENGEKLPIEIYPESKTNRPKWGEMCGFLNEAEREGSDNYLRAVEGCLYLHMGLPKSPDQTDGLSAREVLRKAIYEKIVRNLELLVKPENSKRKRRDSVSDLPVTKKLAISSLTDNFSQRIMPHRAIKPPINKQPTPPACRDGFELAIMCALPVEYNAVSLLFDELWNEDYGSADEDPNIYTTGRIGKLNVVLVLLPNIGKVSAATTSVSLRASFPSLRLVLVTGICGGVPRPGYEEELLLGDVIISKHIVQYDLGKQNPDNFTMRDAVEDNFGRAPRKLRNLLAIFETDIARERLERSVAIHLQEIQKRAAAGKRRRGVKYKYPGALRDRLFQSGYQHKRHISPQCSYTGGNTSKIPILAHKKSCQLSCEELGCDDMYLVLRKRIEDKRQLEREGSINEAQAPSIFVGSIGSGDTVMKSGEDRDRIANLHGLLAFEMEGAGVWDGLSCCIVVKGVCDYADSHKDKIWHEFAAATAASATKALLERYFSSNGLH